jgi:DNA-binding CsgD family transcriptional regulator
MAMATMVNDGLSPREREVMALVARGRANKEIAVALDIAPATVNGHLESIYAKYHVSNRTEAVVEWLRRIPGAE